MLIQIKTNTLDLQVTKEEFKAKLLKDGLVDANLEFTWDELDEAYSRIQNFRVPDKARRAVDARALLRPACGDEV